MADCLCDECAALCCRYFAFPIDNPTCARDFDNIRWYLLHENVVIFVESKQWYMGVMNKCKQLQPDNRCGIYETRPKICREYTTAACDYHGGTYDFERLFTSADDLRIYGLEKLKEWRKAKREKRKRQEARENKAGKDTARPPKRKPPSRKPGHVPAAPTIGKLRYITIPNGNGNGRTTGATGLSLPVLKNRG